ncbi:hypothetical protein Tco_0738311 [Tanacetum coccineum]
MASQDDRLSKFEADFKQQQNEITNKIDTVLKAITDRIAGTLPNDTMREEMQEREGDPEDTNTIAYIKERRDTPLLERKDITAVSNLGSNKDDKGIEWLDVDKPLDLVNTRLGRDMYVFVGNMSYIMDFTILESIETNIDPSLPHVIFGRPFVEIACLAINRKHSEDDFDRGCRKPSDLEDGFYKDTIKLGPEYVTRMDDEGEVTKITYENKCRKFFIKKAKNESSQSVEMASRFARDAITTTLVTVSGYP